MKLSICDGQRLKRLSFYLFNCIIHLDGIKSFNHSTSPISKLKLIRPPTLNSLSVKLSTWKSNTCCLTLGYSICISCGPKNLSKLQCGHSKIRSFFGTYIKISPNNMTDYFYFSLNYNFNDFSSF